MVSTAELYFPLVAGLQFVIAGLILWLGRLSTRAILAATILVANGLQSLANMALNLDAVGVDRAFDDIVRGPREDFVETWTRIDLYEWLALTEMVIAITVGLLALSLVRPIQRRTVGAILFVIIAGIWSVQATHHRSDALHVALVQGQTAFVFALSFVAVCTIALPHVLRLPQSTERLHALVVVAAVLIPMVQQHLRWTMQMVLSWTGDPRYQDGLLYYAVGRWIIGILSVVAFGWAVHRLWKARDQQLVPVVLGGVILSALLPPLVEIGMREGVDYVPLSTQVLAQLLRPALLLVAFARLDLVRIPRQFWRPLVMGTSALMGFGVFMFVQFIAIPNPATNTGFAAVPTLLGLGLAATLAGVLVPRILRGVDEMALESDMGARGARLERYQAALTARDPHIGRLREQLGITHREDEALRNVVAGNLIIPEIAARGLRPGDRLEEYTVVERLGSGGQGLVVRAITPSGESVVVKQVMDAWARGAQERIAALRREASAGHARLREVIETPFAAYLVRDFVPGQTLDKATDADAARVHQDVSRQLAALHARGWVHGDVKPSNIIVTPDGGAVLIDEGAAHQDGATQVLGSTAWMAPEQHDGEHTASADVYQLGRVLEPLAKSGPLRAWVAQALDPRPASRPSLSGVV